jgi:DNA invertase Pin-like site-specific DNA recombinase
MNAVIYCRVSSKDQVDGTSLESQELACREYAKRHNLTVSKVFIEEGESAKFADRTQLLELLTYCREKSRNIETLIVWKIDRFARNVEDHYTIKGALKKLGVQIVSVTEPIQADPNGKLMETILAGFAQFDNDIRALRSVQGMQQRLQEGIWPWMPPLGYKPPKLTKKTRADDPDPNTFEPIRKAWQMFASGAYTKADIIRLLHMWGVHAQRGRLISPQTLDRMFSNPYYAGVLRDPWTGREYAGGHQAMVTDTEFAHVQQLVSSRRNQHSYRRARARFPVRGLVRCPSCEMRMTGYVAQGKLKRYAYYKCFQSNCLTRSKSSSADTQNRQLVDISKPTIN